MDFLKKAFGVDADPMAVSKVLEQYGVTQFNPNAGAPAAEAPPAEQAAAPAPAPATPAPAPQTTPGGFNLDDVMKFMRANEDEARGRQQAAQAEYERRMEAAKPGNLLAQAFGSAATTVGRGDDSWAKSIEKDIADRGGMIKDATLGAAEREAKAAQEGRSAAQMAVQVAGQLQKMGIDQQKAEQEAKTFVLDYANKLTAFNNTAALNDPKSDLSKSLLAQAKAMGLPVPDGMSGAQLQALIPTQMEMVKARAAMVQAQAEMQYKVGKLKIEAQEADTRQAREAREAQERSPAGQAAVTGAKAQAEIDVKKADERRTTIRNIEANVLPAIDNALKLVGEGGSDLKQGPIAGRTPTVTQQGQKLENAYARVQLEAVKAFTSSGGSAQMLNSNAERAAFEAAGPNMKNDAGVNRDILLGQKSLALRSQAMATGMDPLAVSKYVTMYDPKNPANMVLVAPSKVEEQAKKGLIQLQ